VKASPAVKGPILAFVMRYLAGLRFPYLAAITGTLFVVDLVVPDLIPFADELLLGLITVLLGMLKKPRIDRGA
jgi:Family of unknown function (DUF6116)